MHSLCNMLTYKRPEGSDTQAEFCRKYIEPVFGVPDRHGNYIMAIGDKPNILFTAHHDTVHKNGGIQKIIVMNDVVSVSDSTQSSCLGADCTTGIYIILNMIEAQVPGVYAIFAGEELGCVGSTALINDNPTWINDLDAVISFDRKGDNSVITHQSGLRTASDEFAKSFAKAVGLKQLKPDPYGSYTDSNEFAHLVSECTNISVGYYNQHTKNETQDLLFVDKIVDAVINADWSKLVFKRNPEDYAHDHYWYADDKYGYGYDEYDDRERMRRLVDLYPSAVARMLSEYGFTYHSLQDELGFSEYNYDYMWTSDDDEQLEMEEFNKSFSSQYATRRYR